MGSFTTLAVLLGATVLFVPLFRRMGLGSVLGYLAAGVLIGPYGLRAVADPESLLHTAEIGVVLLLFIIGLELQPTRLWALRRQVFGLGTLQLLGVGTVLGLVGYYGFDLAWQVSLLTGWTLALSSTALVLPTLAERKELTTRYGRESFAILLFQDLSVIALLALLPLFGIAGSRAGLRPGTGALVLVAVVIVGRPLLRWLFNYVARFGSREVFTAAALLVALGLALLMDASGLSMSLGAFVAGVLLADSEFRHELEASIAPFETLLLGLFFIAVGMSIDIGLFAVAPFEVLGMALGLLAIKTLSLYLLRRCLPQGKESARPLAFALAQGGEFAFVVFRLLDRGALLRPVLVDELTLAVALSMALSPFFFIANDWLARRAAAKAAVRPYDAVPDEGAPVVIAGFGRVGQIVGRLLAAQGVRYTAVDIDAEQVDAVRRFGMKAYYGDASRHDLMESAGLERAQVLVLAIDDVEASLRTVEMVRKHYPKLQIVARARNRFHAYRLLDLGVERQMRETWASSIALGRFTLEGLGVPGGEVEQLIKHFIVHDEDMLRRQHAVYHDESKLIQTAQEARREFQSILEQDRDAAKQLERKIAADAREAEAERGG
ncbi:monovalent cation:proton antiporter-2 (CPA2) family protein [Niveibacterium sp. SC-1]|uniref:monovalent cation:proton antiporter-2 (CPA2) family protein n=1 Tax=Niveibacterium sp. SC-1 TaxID=3135646 RepID=UPI00311FD5DC